MAFTVQRRGSYQGSNPDEAVRKTNWSDTNGVDHPDYQPYGSVDENDKTDYGLTVVKPEEDEKKKRK